MTRTNSPIRLRWTHYGVFVGLVLPLLLSGQAQAQAGNSAGGADDVWAGVEEMVVSGSSAGGILADVARSNSVTAFSSQDLEAIGAADISDIASFTPNLEIVVAGSTSPTFFIRGIGLNDFNANAAGAVAVYTDDVPINSPALQLGSLFDIENAAVLRGPQGTGPFRNASAGSIKVYSKKPTGDFGVNFKAELGNYESRDFEGSMQFPITDETLWARFSFRTTEREGTFKNRCANAPPFDERLPQGSGPDAGVCGDKPVFGQISNVDTNQPQYLNSRDNWAVRGVFLIQPDVAGDVDMNFLVTVRGSRRDEPSFVGQSIGTSGVNRFLDDDGVPTRDPINGTLGGADNGGFVDDDIIATQTEAENADLANCEPSCNSTQIKKARFDSRRRVSYDLGRELDSDPRHGNISHSGGTTNDTYGASLKAEMEFGDLFEFTSITGFDGWQRVVDIDLDFSPNTLFEIDTQDEGWQVFQELRFNGQLFDSLDELYGGPLDWEIGGFVLHEDLDVDVHNNFGASTGLGGAPTQRKYNQTLLSFGGYTTLSWDFWDAFTIDGGFRFNWEKREIDDYNLIIVGPPTLVADEQIIGQEPTGTIRITWRPNEESSLYAKFTHGWKSGTFNATGSARLGVTSAGQEKIDAFEIGLRGSYFENRLNINTAVFHYTYTDYQLFTSLSAFQSPPQFVIINASDVELYGAEVEATILPWDGGLIDLKFAWLEGEFLSFVRTQLQEVSVSPTINITVPVETDQSGNRLLNAPRYTISMTLQQAFPIGRFGAIVARWDGAWKDTTYFDSSEGRGLPNGEGDLILPKDTIGQRAYWLHNVRLSYWTPDESIEVAAWVRNVADETAKAFSADLTTFQKTTLHFVNQPRTFGVSTSIKF